jgi:hypothetical protein
MKFWEILEILGNSEIPDDEILDEILVEILDTHFFPIVFLLFFN